MPRYFKDQIDRTTFGVLHRRSNWRTVAHGAVVTSLYGLLALASLQTDSVLVRMFIAAVLGVILTGWFSAIHESVHGLFVKNRMLNRLAGLYWACPTLLNFSLYRAYHLEHHRHTTVNGDPEPSGEFGSLVDYLTALTTLWFPVRFLVLSVRSLLGRFPAYARSKSLRWDAVIDTLVLAVWIMFVGLCTLFAPIDMLFIYWLPLTIYFPMLSITGLPEHYGCERTADVTVNTRTTNSNWLFRFIYWNNNYHAEHHCFPQVPFYNLPRLHRIVGEQFKFRQRSFFSFHKSLLVSLIRRNTSTNLDHH